MHEFFVTLTSFTIYTQDKKNRTHVSYHPMGQFTYVNYLSYFQITPFFRKEREKPFQQQYLDLINVIIALKKCEQKFYFFFFFQFTFQIRIIQRKSNCRET